MLRSLLVEMVYDMLLNSFIFYSIKARDCLIVTDDVFVRLLLVVHRLYWLVLAQCCHECYRMWIWCSMVQ